MPFSREQRQSAYNKLPQEVKDLIMSNEVTNLITITLEESGLNEEEANLADSEILCAMSCLQSLDDAIDNIAKLANKNPNDLDKLKSTIQENILSKYNLDINKLIEENRASQSTALEIPPINLPMVEEGEVAHDALPLTPERSDGGQVPHIAPTPSPEPAPTPIAETITQPLDYARDKQPPAPSAEQEPRIQTPLPDYRYPDGKDPYREPLV